MVYLETRYVFEQGVRKMARKPSATGFGIEKQYRVAGFFTPEDYSGRKVGRMN